MKTLSETASTRLNSMIKQILTEKKKPKNKAKDIDIESAFTKEVPQPEESEEASFMREPSIEGDPNIPTNASPVDPETMQKPGFSKEEQEIQNSLKVAYDHAVSIGDQKLATQIANSLKFFVSTHIVAGGV